MTEQSAKSKVYISGIGGSGAAYLAKYFLATGWDVLGSDISESERVKEVKKLGAQVFLESQNADELEALGVNLHIYSAALRTDHPERLYFDQENVDSVEVGEYTDQLLSDYFGGELSKQEVKTLKEVDLAPLLKIDWSAKKYIAITGTDGKTTTTTMIYHLLQNQGKKAAIISTLGMEINGELMETGLHTTTPTAQELYGLLTDKLLKDVEFVVLETTSHGLAMGRLAGAKFDVAIVTNITSEHLDYHHTWEEYFESKARLVENHLKEDGVAVLNPFDEKAYFKLEKLCTDLGINYLTIDHTDVEKVALPALHNTIYNRQNGAQAIKAVNQLLPDVEPLRLFAALHSFEGVRGRMEMMQAEPFQVIVDFAHTSNSLEKVLRELRQRLPEGKGLHVVFGCAGMRDKTKREPMGRAAAELADAIYICPEDPRLESLAEINHEILKGAGFQDSQLGELQSREYVELTDANGKGYRVFQKPSPDARLEAIKSAISNAQPGDIVVICGKGHEKSLNFGKEELEWSDQEAVLQILGQK